ESADQTHSLTIILQGKLFASSSSLRLCSVRGHNRAAFSIPLIDMHYRCIDDSIADISEEDALMHQTVIAEEQYVSARKEENQHRTTAFPALPSHYIEFPEGVLRIIFNLFCQLMRDSNFRILVSPVLTLSHVCSAWRRIILDMPQMWAQIPFFVRLHSTEDSCPRNDYCMNYQKLRLIRLWLTRGGSHPRRELIVDHRNIHGRSSDVVEQLVAPFPFTRLILGLEFDDIITITKIPPEHMLHLQSPSIGYRRKRPTLYGTRITIPAGTLRLPEKLPNLEILSLCDCFAEDLGKVVTAVPWHNLTQPRLQFDIPSTTCLNVILRQGTSLFSCHLKPTSDIAFSRLPDTEPLLVLSNMCTLALHCSSQADVAIFNRLVLTPKALVRHIKTYAYYEPDVSL
ncbi:hypothetical protein F5887DRAFT_1256715, partial [Amanita rubescens]